jgi:ribonuclease III
MQNMIIDLSDYGARLGVTFKDMLLLQRALTHRSYLNEHPDANLQDNERLEFLGDAVLDFIAAEWLFERFPDLDEGTLTRLRAGMVRNETLASYSAALGLGDLLLLGKGEEEHGGRSRLSNLGSTFEAFCGALYLDQGLEAVRQFAKPWFAPVLDDMMRERSDKDAKSLLQEWAQAHLGLTPAYRTAQVTGPDHDRQFTIEVLVGEQVLGVGQGRSKQLAAQAAARVALDGLENKG